MTISFLSPDGVPLTAQQERQTKAAQYGGGSGRPLGGRSGFRVGTASTILTASSTTWTLLPCAAMIDPGASTHQGMYGWSSDANVTGAVTAADATYARKDIVYIQVNDSSAGDGSGALTANVSYLAGPMDGTNVPPALPARSFLVGTISVPIAGGGSPTVVRNPAVFVAAGAPLPVESQTAQDALTQYPASEIIRTDDKYKTYISDGTKWMPHADAQGMTLRKKSTTNGIGLTSLSVVENFATYDFKAGRKYRIIWQGGYSMSEAGNYFALAIHTASTADAAGLTTGLTQIMSRTYTSNAAGFGESFYVEGIYEPSADETKQIKFTVSRAVGAGTWAIQAAATAPAYYYIEDLGAQF
jgi:hypothetical protein